MGKIKNKKFIKIFALIIVLLIIIAVVINISYSAILSNINKNKIIGEWAGFGYTYKFTSNGKFTGEWHNPDEEENFSYYEGSYKVTGNKIILYINLAKIEYAKTNYESISQKLIDGTYSLKQRYKLKFSQEFLHMDGLNIDEFLVLARNNT